ncbi:hypothetical protein K435DRAFT_971779 [Dendrothele bispora CBS 962.96]|uniref:Monopolin complex subunit Csm1/Pcs1 C-terminal domain-containing protein n=1 Tax=Dendrothele bispora (strain CBS 962.96) TaxID=1314807 RepID=A0A4S8L4B5_DENBC|nr:hypothetical protein K435DRAFT_971779 [Dendrothele bispora CBS 962.96]
MSDDSADLGGFGPTTPLTKTARSSKPKSKSNAAGPSTKTKSKTTATSRKRQRVADPPLETTEMEVINVDDNDGEEEDDELASTIPEEVPPPKTTSSKSRTRSSREGGTSAGTSNAATIVVNGRHPSGNGKGKKAMTGGSRTKAAPAATETIDLNNAEGSEEESTAPSLVHAINNASGSRPQRRQHGEHHEDKLRKRAEQAEARCEQLRKQVEELLRVRETEAEELLREERAQNEAQQKAKDQLIRELNSALAKIEPLARQGKTSVINLLTREAADIEKRQLEEELMQYKAQLEQTEESAKEKDNAIDELEMTIKELRFELDMERKQKAAPPKPVPGSAQRGRRGVLGNDEPKNTQLVKAYEDLTNLLICDVKQMSKSYLDLDNWLWTCIYTYVSQDGSIQKSINFQIKALYELPKDAPDPETKDDLMETIYYVPLELDKEEPEFVEKLGFLGNSFSFSRSQLALFLRTMHDFFAKALGAEQSADISMESGQMEDDDVQFVEAM